MISGISVIVPTEGRVELVETLLVSLVKAIKNTTTLCEIIIVDSSSGMEAEHIRTACARHDVKYFTGRPSVRQKRNLGASMAQYDVLLFIDSDCYANEDLLVEHLRTYSENVRVKIGGVLGITEFTGESNWVWKIIEQSPFLDAFQFAKQMPHAVWCTCTNVSFKKSVFEEVGGFDQNLPFKLGGDDLDFSWRVTLSGYLICCNERAVVFHTRKTWQRFSAMCERIFRWGRMNYYIMKKHRSHLQFRMPGLLFASVVALLIGTAAVVTGLHSMQIFARICASLMVGSVILFWFERECTAKNFFQQIGAHFLVLLYHLGAMIEFFRHAKLNYLNSAIYFDDWHQRAEYERQMRRVWIILGALGFVFLISG